MAEEVPPEWRTLRGCGSFHEPIGLQSQVRASSASPAGQWLLQMQGNSQEEATSVGGFLSSSEQTPYLFICVPPPSVLSWSSINVDGATLARHVFKENTPLSSDLENAVVYLRLLSQKQARHVDREC